MQFLLLLMINLTPLTQVTETPERISRTATITINAPIENAFPLFGPIREKDWADGWDPEIIYSKTNLVEQHMVFRTTGRNAIEPFYTWMITTYNPDQHLIEYTVSTAHRIWTISVQCAAREKKTTAAVTYTFTSLTDEGREFNRTALHNMYAEELKDWERAINYYMETGKVLVEH